MWLQEYKAESSESKALVFLVEDWLSSSYSVIHVLPRKAVPSVGVAHTQ